MTFQRLYPGGRNFRSAIAIGAYKLPIAGAQRTSQVTMPIIVSIATRAKRMNGSLARAATRSRSAL
jgi:hypothetical protein